MQNKRFFKMPLSKISLDVIHSEIQNLSNFACDFNLFTTKRYTH